MYLLKLNLENFRNIEFAQLTFDGSSQFLIGANGQGKTNLLEAVGFISALRSFRTQEIKHLIQEGKPQARIYFKMLHDTDGEVDVTLTFSATAKSIEVNREKMARLADFIGRFPTVVLSSEDIQLLRGAPQLRRRLLDLILSTLDKDYFLSLRRYHRALRERNTLLRQESIDLALLQSFDKSLFPEACALYQKRTAGVLKLNEILEETYQAISQRDEQPELLYKPNAIVPNVETVSELFLENRTRDALLKSTQRGPHRDDLAFRIQGKPARDFASEGQQRGLIVALRLAQLKLYQKQKKIKPLVLADDVLGELDPQRRAGFWKTVEPDCQILATGTTMPQLDSHRDWHLIQVASGAFTVS